MEVQRHFDVFKFMAGSLSETCADPTCTSRRAPPSVEPLQSRLEEAVASSSTFEIVQPGICPCVSMRLSDAL